MNELNPNKEKPAPETKVSRMLFIVNPVAGNHRRESLLTRINRHFPEKAYNWEVAYSNYRGHAREMARKAVEDGFSVVVAVGGDGTFNEVAQGVHGSDVAAGIIPAGSGNGMANYLDIPGDTDEALNVIKKHKIRETDVWNINGIPFFATAGAGFDARVGDLFSRQKIRGFWGYARITLREFFSYKAKKYIVNGEAYHDILTVTFANIDQYGNDFFIAPGASSSDGMLDLVFIKAFPPARLPEMLWQLKNRRIHQSPFFYSIRCSYAKVERPGEGPVQVDGEPYAMDRALEIKSGGNRLKVITG